MNIHPSATIHPNAELAEGVSVGPYVVIGEHVRLGTRTVVRPHAVIEGWTASANTVTSASARFWGPPQDLKYRGQRSFLRVGDHTCIREYVSVHRVPKKTGLPAFGRTIFSWPIPM